MDQKPVLITAFKPWGTLSSNLTQDLVNSLKPVFESRNVHSVVLDTLYDTVGAFADAINPDDYAHIISLGIMGQSYPPIRFETCARRIMFKSDDRGITPVFQNCAANPELKGSKQLLSLRVHDNLGHYDIGESHNAGNFLCEYMYYKMLERTQETQTGAVFIHLSNENLEAKKKFLLDYLEALQMTCEQKILSPDI